MSRETLQNEGFVIIVSLKVMLKEGVIAASLENIDALHTEIVISTSV